MVEKQRECRLKDPQALGAVPISVKASFQKVIYVRDDGTYMHPSFRSDYY